MATAYEIVMDSRKKLVNSIIENMKKGYMWSPAWDTTVLRPYNPISDCYYAGCNRARLMMAAIDNDYKDPRWCTYNQAQEQGWAVKRGSQSVLLEKWIFSEHKIQEDEFGNKVKVEIELERPKVCYFRVFNGEQIHGIPSLELWKDPDFEQAIDITLKSSQCPITERADFHAYYSPAQDEIFIPSRFSFKSPEAFLSTVLHEMSHSTGHPERINRPLFNTFGTPDYAREELRAELGSAFTKCDLHLPLSNEQLQEHSSYMSSWIKILQEDPNEFFRACQDAEKISSYLYHNYERILEAEASPAAIAIEDKTPEERCRAGMKELGYEWIETDPDSMATVSFRHLETGKTICCDGWLAAVAELEELQYRDAIEKELLENRFSPNADLMKNICWLHKHTGKNLSLKEIAAMVKQPPDDLFCKELLKNISEECCRQELEIQTMDKLVASFAWEPI